MTRPRESDYVAEVIAAWASRYLTADLPLRTEAQRGDVVVEETGEGAFQVEVRTGHARFRADEPVEVGGLGTGPTPYDLLGAGLGACTAMTLRLYARRKDLPLDRVRVTVGHKKGKGAAPDLFVREISLTGTLSDEQTKRLLEIADRCPVHRTLESGAGIQTELEGARPRGAIDRPTQHVLDTQESIGAAD